MIISNAAERKTVTNMSTLPRAPGRTRKPKPQCRVLVRAPSADTFEVVGAHEVADVKKAVLLRKLIESDAKHRIAGMAILVRDIDDSVIESRVFDGEQWRDNVTAATAATVVTAMDPAGTPSK